MVDEIFLLHLPNAIMGFSFCECALCVYKTDMELSRREVRILLHSIRLLYNLQDIGFAAGGAGSLWWES